MQYAEIARLYRVPEEHVIKIKRSQCRCTWPPSDAGIIHFLMVENLTPRELAHHWQMAHTDLRPHLIRLGIIEPNRDEAIARMLAEGRMTQKEIADSLGLSRSTITHIANKRGLYKHNLRNKLSPARKREIVQRRHERAADLAKEYKVTVQTIYNIWKCTS
jgi:DNA-binding XRE family transcriptional regulator